MQSQGRAGINAPPQESIFRLPPTGSRVRIRENRRTGRIVGRAVSSGNLVLVIALEGSGDSVIAGVGQVERIPDRPRLAAVDGVPVAGVEAALSNRETCRC